MDLEYPYDTYHPSPIEHLNTDFATPNIDEGFAQGSPSRQSSMQRCLQDPDRPYFHPASHEDNDNSTHAYPSVPHNGNGPINVYTHDALHIAVGYSSPSGSTFDSAYNSSGMSGGTASPWRSPQMTNVALSPEFRYSECTPQGLGNQTASSRHDSIVSRSCVAMHDVQPQADVQPNAAAFQGESFDYSSFGAFAQEGYQSIGPADNANTPATYPGAIDIDVDASDMVGQQDTAPMAIRPRRTPRPTPTTTPSSSTRIARRPRGSQTSSSRNVGDLQDGRHAAPSTPAGPFLCPLTVYGCTSSFGSKNEWKRHVATQHIRLGFWQCDLCHRGNKTNDFNRKDLFIQHVRRMHTEALGLPALGASRRIDERSHRDTSLEDAVLHEASARCYVELRSPPGHSRCLFCEDEFHGPGSWEQRMEHVSVHLEAAKKERRSAGDPSHWKSDEAVHNWLVAEGLVVVRGQSWVLADSGRRKSVT